LAGVQDADILREMLELMGARINAGRATFFFKVKSLRVEALNERADTVTPADIYTFRVHLSMQGPRAAQGPVKAPNSLNWYCNSYLFAGRNWCLLVLVQ